LCPI